MAKGDPKKSKGKMTAYVFFVQTCRVEHKKNPVPVLRSLSNLLYFPRNAPRGGRLSGKEKSKFNEMAEVDKMCYDR